MTGRCLDEFHRLFGIRYPWGEYHQAFVPDFNAGAMENPGCVTLRDTYVFRSRVTELERGQRASTVAHEMAHMWFGDLVTMRWWDDLWLNESFAEYLGYRVCDDVTDHPSWVEFGAVRKAWGYAADRRPSTHPVAGNGAADAKSALSDFDGISYAKGAAVLRQLAAHLGDDTLFSGLRSYFHTHAYGNATFADLIGAWTAAGATDMATWADAWLRTSGLDTLRRRPTPARHGCIAAGRTKRRSADPTRSRWRRSTPRRANCTGHPWSCWIRSAWPALIAPRWSSPTRLTRPGPRRPSTRTCGAGCRRCCRP